MPIEVECPKCGGFLRLEEHLAGKQVECVECGTMMTVPELESRPQEQAAAPSERGISFDDRMAVEAERIKRQQSVPFLARHTGAIVTVALVVIVGLFLLKLPWLIQRLTVQGDITLIDTGDRPQRQAAARHLAEAANATAVTDMIRLLKHEDSFVREACAEGLAKVGDKRACAALIEALGDESISVRRQAAWALGTCGTEEAVAPLRKLIDSPNTPDELVPSARFALCKLGDSGEFDELVRALNDPGPQARTMAAQALGALGRPEAIPYLEKALAENPALIKAEIVKAIEKLKRQEH